MSDDGRRRVRELYARRLFEGLTRPYGARAQKLGIGHQRPRRLTAAQVRAEIKAASATTEAGNDMEPAAA